MTKKKKVQSQVTAPTAVRPRLVKAGEVAAREAAMEAERRQEIQARAKEPVVNAALKRTPRNAVEARDMFNALFNEAA